jgi:hypothetical protein
MRCRSSFARLRFQTEILPATRTSCTARAILMVWWVTFDSQGTRLAYGGLDGIAPVVDFAQMGRLDKADAAEL